MIRCGIIGYGLAGAVFHAPLVRAAAGLEWVAVSTSKRESVPSDVSVCSHEELIARPDVDLVVIASPNQSHFPLARAALEAGKHVVVDKPFTVSTAEADALIRLATQQRRVLTVFHNRRWDGDFMTVKALLESGRLSKVTLFEAHWDRFRPDIAQRWRELPGEGAGLLYDLGPHLIDQALLLFGRPDAIAADLATQREGAEVDDYFELTLHYGSMRAILASSRLIAEPRPRFGVHGDGGSFVKYGLDTQEDALRNGAAPLDPGFGADPLHGTFTSPEDGREPVPTLPARWLTFYEAVAAAIRGEAPVPVDPADARAGLEILELAFRSAREGRRLAL